MMKDPWKVKIMFPEGFAEAAKGMTKKDILKTIGGLGLGKQITFSKAKVDKFRIGGMRKW